MKYTVRFARYDTVKLENGEQTGESGRSVMETAVKNRICS